MTSFIPGSFSRVFRIGDQFQVFHSTLGDGFLYNRFGANRLFYVRDTAKGEELLTALSTGGPEAADAKCASDPAVSAMWAGMKAFGFLGSQRSHPRCSLAWYISPLLSVSEQLELFKPGWKLLDSSLPVVHFEARDATDILGGCALIQEALEHLSSGRAFAKPPSPTLPNIRVYSNLTGDELCAAPLIDFLERGSIQLVYQVPALRLADSNPVLARLEAEGFLPPHRLIATAADIRGAAGREVIFKMIERCLEGEPNREIDLCIERPHMSASADDWHKHFDGVQELLASILALNADLSRLSFLNRAIFCMLHSVEIEYFLEATATDRGYDLRSFFDREYITTVVPDPQIFEQLGQRLDRYTQTEAHSDHTDDPFDWFCPRSLTEAFLTDASPGASEWSLVAGRQRGIWRGVFGWLLQEFLEVSRENVGFGTPLRLDISQDRKAIYSPLY